MFGSRIMQKCQFDRFSLQINFKEHVVVITEFPDWVQVKQIYYTTCRNISSTRDALPTISNQISRVSSFVRQKEGINVIITISVLLYLS